MDWMREGLYPEGSITRRVNRENVLILGGGRALLMQLAHPMVAAGVDEHSDFRQRPMYRLRRTIRLTMAIVFGDRETALAAARAVNQTHGRVRGERYRALDPDLLLWVHATLVDSALATYETFVKPLPARELAGLVLRPRLRLLPGPAMIPFEVVTAGLLPAELREQYGLSWSARQERLFRLMVIAIPRLVAVTPPVLRVWPLPGRNVSLARDLSLSA